MLILEKIEDVKRGWVLTKVDNEYNFESEIIRLEFDAFSITNKFEVVADMVSDMCNKIPEFSDWYSSLINKYIIDGYDPEVLLNSTNEFIDMSQRYVKETGVDFSSFTNKKKATKTSIIFEETDIREIAVSSICLKLYSIFQYDKTIKPNDNMHRKIFEKILEPCVRSGTPTKIFQLTRSRIYRSNVTDKYMWDLIRMAISETPESYIMHVFNYVMSNMIATLSIYKNPVPYIVSLVDDSVRWLMKNIYKNRTIYGEVFGSSEDIYGSSVSKESFYVYCCNDLIGKAAKVGMNLLENEYLINGTQFDDVRDRIDKIDVLTHPMRLVILPIASKVLDIPYKYLLTCPPKHVLLIGILLYHISKGILDIEYPIIHEFLISYPKEQGVLSVKSLYRIKNYNFIINNKKPIFGFAVKTLKRDVFNKLCGILSSSKRSMVSVIDGSKLKKITYYSLESDVIGFFTDVYSNKYEEKFNKMKEMVDGYF